MHLGTFAAATPIDRAVLDTASGTATYRGHAAGNVMNGGAVYSAIGTYSDTFDFDRRRGSTMLDFDSRRYGGSSSLDSATYRARLSGGDRQAALQGQFGGGMENGRPRAVTGGFEISNGRSGGSAYRATGIFAGEAGR